MRYEKGHKSASQDRILDVAAGRFREGGIAATGMTGIMSEAGLTNGAFYTHFESKDELIRLGLERSLDEQIARLTAVVAPGDLVSLVEAYLSSTHRDQPGSGCASAATLSELARQSEETRGSYTVRLRQLVGEIARRLPDASGSGKKEQAAIAIFALLVGTLQLARAVNDRDLSDTILASGIAAARTLAV